MPRRTLFSENLHYVPATGWTLAACCVVRAGKVAAAPDYRIERSTHPGQDILYCLSGEGIVETLGQRAQVRAGQLVWIANERPHMHAADPRRPWTLLWFRLDAPDPAGLREKLFGADFPRATFGDGTQLIPWFDRLFSTMRGHHPALDLRLNYLVAEFLVIVDQCLARTAAGDAPPCLTALIDSIRGNLSRRWTAPDLSATTGLSHSQTRRLFRKYLHTSPRQWLIRERLMRAQALLVQTERPLALVAEICGFCDVYHLSKEFKRLVGISPAAWRRSEIGAVARARRGESNEADSTRKFGG